eukprot:6826066-Prorocentrum_lima.AAC.1
MPSIFCGSGLECIEPCLHPATGTRSPWRIQLAACLEVGGPGGNTAEAGFGRRGHWDPCTLI